ncbi:MAG: hypothetical protein ACHQU8_07005, partial [Gemmatimonadales bacterium]
MGAGLMAHHAGHLGGFGSVPASARRQQRVMHDTLQPRETLSQLFARRGVNDVDWSGVSHAVKSFDPSRVRAGTVFQFTQSQGESSPHAIAVRVSYDTR